LKIYDSLVEVQENVKSNIFVNFRERKSFVTDIIDTCGHLNI